MISMKIENNVFINASETHVWDVTTDVEKWPEWTPTIDSVKRMDKGSFGKGSKVLLKQPMQPEAEWTVTRFEAGQLFAWETYRRGMHITAYHELTPNGGGTENKLVVEMKGALVILLWPIFKLAVSKALADENNGLKIKCEESGSF
jgi:hypothetical protein